MRLSICIVGIALAIPEMVHATPTFPAVLEDAVGTAGPPPCSICHQADLTTNYTVRTAFGAALKTRGLVPENEASLRSALAALERDGTDSDYDGVADIAELEAGRDPNQPGDEPAGPPLEYGCAVRTHREEPAGFAVTAFAFVSALWVVRRRRGEENDE